MKKQPGRKAGKLLDKTVFGFFENFSNPDDEVRIRGASALIEFLRKDGNADKRTGKDPADATNATATTGKTAEMAYALKRLVRGVGSPTNVSKVGYYTALVGLLQQHKSAEDCPTVTELFKLVKSELADSEHDPAESNDAKERNRFEVRVGKVLVCGAIIKAGLIENATDLELQTIFTTLKTSMYKTLTKLVWTFLNELVACISGSKFSQIFWPLFESLLNVPKEQHTMDTVYFLLLLLDGPHAGMVNKKYFLRNFDTPSLLHEKAFPYLGEILFGIDSTMGINHPFINCLLEKLLKVEKVVAFWQEGVIPVLALPDDRRPKYRDIMFPHLVLTWFGRLQDYSVIPNLLQPALITLFSEKLENLSKFSEDVKKLYQEACKAIVETYPKLGDESVRLATYRCLTQGPGGILIEKYASCKLLQNLLATLSKDTLKIVAVELKAIILDSSTDNYVQRTYAAHMLQRLLSLRQLLPEPRTKATEDWHLEMIRFFLILGVFYSADGKTVLKPSKHESAVNVELATTAKAVFFHLLEHRHTNISEEHDFLLSLVRCIHEAFKSPDGVKGLRNPLTEAHINDWNRMYTSVTERADGKKRITVHAHDEDKQRTVFHVLMMHMGLHLFNDAELAHSSITELESVMKRIDGKAKQRRKSITKGDPEEPEWIEVVVDLFLNLLSQNSLLLRKVISNVFPHLSGAMTLTAFNQILSVINLKDKTNPLAAQGDDENGQAGQDDNNEIGENDDNDSEYSESSDDEERETNANNEETEEDADEVEDDDDEIMGDEEEDETITDKMRQAVQAALGSANPDSEAESLDLDDIDEEQGRRMDIALAEAFRSFRKNRKPGGKQKPTKAEQQMDTVLTHFRMRVFDLIDVYLKHEPDMIICLELMLYVFEMLPIAIREEAKYGPVLNRYRQIFDMLTRIKQFRRSVVTSDVDASQLNQILRDLIDKVAKGAPFPERNQYLLKACQFIVICSQLLEKQNDASKPEGKTNGDVTNGATPLVDNDVLQVDKLFGKQLTEYLTSRNPAISFNVFQSLFRMNWSGNWYLAIALTSTGLQVATIRAQRRMQTLQLLRELLKNRRFIKAELPKAASSLRTICIALTKYIADLEEAIGGSKNGERSIGQNELYELLQVLLEMHNLQQHQNHKECKKQPMLRWDRIGAQVQALRRFNLNSQTMSCYRQLCQRLKLTPIGNGDIHINGASAVQSKKDKKSRKSKEQDDQEKSEEPDTSQSNGLDSNSTIHSAGEPMETAGEVVKRKRKQQDVVESKKEKRRKKEERLLIASQGMETISFANGS